MTARYTLPDGTVYVLTISTESEPDDDEEAPTPNTSAADPRSSATEG